MNGFIKHATPQHVFQAAEIVDQLYPRVFHVLSAEKYANLARVSRFFLVYEIKGEVVGFILAYTDRDWLTQKPNWLNEVKWDTPHSGEIIEKERFLLSDQVGVKPEWQGKHIGTKLYERLEFLARKAKFKRMFAEIQLSPYLNEYSIKWHERRGFIPVGTRDDQKIRWGIFVKYL